MLRRICRDCPIPNCEAKSLARLSNHLTDVHNLDSTERRKWLQESRLQPKETVMVYDREQKETSMLCFNCANETLQKSGRTTSIKRQRQDCPIPKCGARYLARLSDHLRTVHKLNQAQRRKWLSEARVQRNVKLSPINYKGPNRPRRDCPIPNCGARYLTRLSDHLRTVHKLNQAQRRKWLQEAKLQPKVYPMNYTDECGDEFPSRRRAVNKGEKRICHKCPIPHCGERYQAKLSTHLRIVHQLNRIERRKWLKEAKLKPKQAVMQYIKPQNDDESELCPSGAPSRKIRRVCRDCPIPNCGAKYLSRLPRHLAEVHNLDVNERKKWLKQAKLQS